MDVKDEQLLERAALLEERLRKHRRALHRHPELAFAEHRTADYIEAVLDELAIPHRRVVGTGVVAQLPGRGARSVGIRADMDALPVPEAPGREDYRSEVDGVSHACGHDAHVAIVLGVAELLAGFTELPGTVVLYFQPAEEGSGGAAPMVKAGVLADPRPAAVLGLHVSSRHDSGLIAVARGAVTASTDTVQLRIEGVGGHAAHPHHAVDPVPIAAQVVSGVQHLVAREVSPLRPAVVTFGSIRGGTAANIIASTVELEATVRTLDAEVREHLLGRIEALAAGIATAHRASAAVAIHRGFAPGFNDPALTELLADSAAAVLGDERVVSDQPSMGAEDFFAFGDTGVPVSMFRLGVANAELGITAPHHSPEFDVDEAALPAGVAVFVAAARRVLEGEGAV